MLRNHQIERKRAQPEAIQRVHLAARHGLVIGLRRQRASSLVQEQIDESESGQKGSLGIESQKFGRAGYRDALRFMAEKVS